jgi:outer membrane protein OmpA-like peptidoglycan-associated protein
MTNDSNTQLSVRRVYAVRNYLVKKGIDGKRIYIKGFGGKRPIASNANEETRKLNRRVEVFIVSM